MTNYIHYGSNKFDINKFNKIKNKDFFVKPFGGLWASDINSKLSWKDWCEYEEYNLENLKENFIFSLKENSKVLTITNCEQLNNLPVAEQKFDLKLSGFIMLDFEKLSKEYDAIEVLISNDYKLNWCLCGWDCDSILIMNPEIIKEN